MPTRDVLSYQTFRARLHAWFGSTGSTPGSLRDVLGWHMDDNTGGSGGILVGSTAWHFLQRYAGLHHALDVGADQARTHAAHDPRMWPAINIMYTGQCPAACHATFHDSNSMPHPSTIPDMQVAPSNVQYGGGGGGGGGTGIGGADKTPTRDPAGTNHRAWLRDGDDVNGITPAAKDQLFGTQTVPIDMAAAIEYLSSRTKLCPYNVFHYTWKMPHQDDAPAPGASKTRVLTRDLTGCCDRTVGLSITSVLVYSVFVPLYFLFSSVFLPHLRLYEVVSCHVFVRPYKYRNTDMVARCRLLAADY